jgi:hypothetical protein
MECFDDSGNEFELAERPYAMPAKVILDVNERPDEILLSLQDRYNKLVEEFAAQELSRHYSRETRYADEREEPSFPIVTRQLSTSTRPRSTVVLPDGRKAILLDQQRIQTLCGIQAIMRLSDAQQMGSVRKGDRLCPQCHGKHLPNAGTTPVTSATSFPTIACPKCQANLRSSAYWDGDDTLVCIPCGKRITRPLMKLTREEEDANDLALTHAPVIEPSAAGDLSEEEADGLGDQLDDLEPADSITESGDDHISPFDEDITIEELPETTPIDAQELREIQAMLADPTRRFETTGHSIVIQQLLAMTRARMDNPADHEAFKTVFAEVVSEEIGQLGDLIHSPACHLFKSSKSPLRQGLIDHAIQQTDHADRRMAIWAAAGRLLSESNSAWLKDFHAEVDPSSVPQQKKARSEFWRRLRTARKAQVRPIVEWLHSLSREDLALLAGDPEATHPFVHHPDPDVFQDTDTLLNPLILFLANELQRFRQKESGCQLLADDYGLDVETLKAIARQTGQLPPSTQAPTAHAA